MTGVLWGVVPAAAAGTHNNTAPPTHEHASSPGTTQAPVNWSQHDTAVYVVSTLNLLHTRTGQSFADLLTHKYNVTHYDVYADQNVSNLYYIQLRRDDGSMAGAFAYSMGWSRPRIVFLGIDKPQASHAPQRIAAEYHTDSKILIGSFTSTLPS
jgi:hypothetical protein